MHYSMGSPDLFEIPSLHMQDLQHTVRKSTKWEPTEHKISISVYEIVIVEGHRRGKCFFTTGWQHINALFNSRAGKDWTILQLENYWGKLRTEHKHPFELL